MDLATRAAKSKDEPRLRSLLHKLKGSGAAMHVNGLLNVIDEYSRLKGDELFHSIVEDADELKSALRMLVSEIQLFVQDNGRNAFA